MDNPKGCINNSELELAGVILSAYLASAGTPSTHTTIWCTSDNMAAVAWANTGSTSTTSPSAFLLRTLGQLSQQRHFTLTAFHVAGVANELADFLSRRFDLSWDAVHAALLSRFPSQISWQIVQPPLDSLSLVTSSLSKQIWDAAYPLATPLPNPPPGSFGNGSVTSCDRIPIFAPATTQSPYYNYLPGATAQAPWLHWSSCS